MLSGLHPSYTYRTTGKENILEKSLKTIVYRIFKLEKPDVFAAPAERSLRPAESLCKAIYALKYFINAFHNTDMICLVSDT